MYFVIWLWNLNSYVLEKWYENWSFSIKLRIRITIWSDQNETRVIHCFHCYSCSRVELSQSVECPQQHDLCMVYQKLQAFMIAARILNMIGSAHRKKKLAACRRPSIRCINSRMQSITLWPTSICNTAMNFATFLDATCWFFLGSTAQAVFRE